MGVTDTQLSLSNIGQIAIPVRDVATAIRFYRDTLGMRLLFEAPPGLAFFDCGGIRLMLSAPEQPELAPPGSIIYYKVGDIHAAYDTLRRRGVEFLEAPRLIARLEAHDLWLASFRDSEGNLLALMSEVPR